MHRKLWWLSWMLAMTAVMSILACSDATTTTPPTATDLLMRAQQAPLHDLAMLVIAQIDFGGAWGHQHATITGQGQMTLAPHRVAWHFASTDVGPNPEADVFSDEQGTTWMKTADRPTWSTHDDSPSSFLSRGDFLDYTPFTGARMVGAETVSGVATWHVTAIPPLAALAPLDLHGGISTTVDVWFRQRDAYPLRVVFTGRGDTSTPNGNGQEIIAHQSITTTLTFSQWDVGVNLVPPVSA